MKSIAKLLIFVVGIACFNLLLSLYGSYVTFAVNFALTYIIVALVLPGIYIWCTPSLKDKFLKYICSVPYTVNE